MSYSVVPFMLRLSQSSENTRKVKLTLCHRPFQKILRRFNRPASPAWFSSIIEEYEVVCTPAAGIHVCLHSQRRH